MAGDDVRARLDRLETQLEEMRHELEAVRSLAAPAPELSPIETVVAAPLEPVAVAPTEPAVVAPSSLAAAWRALERGSASAALDLAFEAVRVARVSGDVPALVEVAAFAEIAVTATQGRQRDRAHQLVARVDLARAALEVAAVGVRPEPAVAAPPRPSLAPPVPAPRPAAAAVPSAPREWAPEPTPALERLMAWLQSELTGARLFAVVGGSVTLLGVIFLFVLAANRGWVGPGERVALGAAASLAVLLAGVALRHRYGRANSALAAAGAGIAGLYATLAAATLLYDYLSPEGALLVASGIAAVGAWIAIAWSSQILAGLALVGAAAAPGAVALDDGIEATGAAFALIVLVATVVVASPRRWLELETAVAVLTVGQVVWLVGGARADDEGAVAVACAASVVLLAAAIAWQAYGEPGLDGPAASFALAAGGVGLLGPIAVLADDRRAGLVLLGLAVGFAAVAVAAGRRWRDLAWVIGAEALLLGGVAAAYLVTGRSLTIVWAIEATVLVALAWKLATPRFAAAALVYLAAGGINAFAIEIAPHWPESAFDVPRAAAAGLVVLTAASLLVALLLPSSRADTPAQGITAVLEPLWDALVSARVGLRALLAATAAVLAVFATAAVLSGRPLTVLWAALAAAAGATAYAIGERRLQPFALGSLAYAVVHGLAVEVPPRTLAIESGFDPTGTRVGTLDALVDPIAPVASLVAIAAAASVLAALAHFDDRGIAWLGPLAGPELRLSALRDQEGQIRAVLALVAAGAASWAAGLVAIDLSYEWGQVVATALWTVLGTAVVFRAVRARAATWQVVGGTIVLLAFVKSAALDWDVLGDGAAVTSMLVVAAGMLISGFQVRFGNPSEAAPVEIASLASGAAAAAVAIAALERLFGIDERALGVASLVVVIVLTASGAPAYLGWRSGREEPWLRRTANGYWAMALGALLFAESVIVGRDQAGVLAVWAATAAALALVWRPLLEDRVWAAALTLTTACAVGTVALITQPEQLVEASAHPAAGLWVLAIVIGSAWAVALTLPDAARPWTSWVIGSAAGLTLYGASLGVLEVVERTSGASVTTDFQRAHTVLSALWGIGALALYVVGLARDRRDLRVVGLTLFGLALAKLFLYDLSTLSSITRAFSFLALGAILLAAGFFAERLVRPDGSDSGGTEGPTGTSAA